MKEPNFFFWFGFVAGVVGLLLLELIWLVVMAKLGA